MREIARLVLRSLHPCQIRSLQLRTLCSTTFRPQSARAQRWIDERSAQHCQEEDSLFDDWTGRSPRCRHSASRPAAWRGVCVHRRRRAGVRFLEGPRANLPGRHLQLARHPARTEARDALATKPGLGLHDGAGPRSRLRRRVRCGRAFARRPVCGTGGGASRDDLAGLPGHLFDRRPNGDARPDRDYECRCARWCPGEGRHSTSEENLRRQWLGQRLVRALRGKRPELRGHPPISPTRACLGLHLPARADVRGHLLQRPGPERA
mmetsp:Transcript_106431/g.339619  ORF Transcript_106431/g.339619 Transcript_106431/m.339619 type:complete len:264 (+) Transcript_106431:867-1658(+)